MIPSVRFRLACSLALLLVAASAGAQETARVTLPTWVTFDVFDVTAATTGSPNPTRVEFSEAQLLPGNVLRISVRAEAAAFSSPPGAAIPASSSSWTAAGAVGGTGSSGTLDDGFYTPVFQSSSGATAGSVDLTWTLAPLGSGVRAGSHQISLRWKVESVVP
jgi:hypothetical protein